MGRLAFELLQHRFLLFPVCRLCQIHQGDAYFYDLFCRHAAFLSTAQIHSQDPRIDGAWARGFDAEQMEVCGLPNDVGWGPWAVESGWTVAEICAGLLQGVLKDKLKEFYK